MMLCLITVTAVVSLFLWQLVRKNPPKVNNIYSQPGKWYWLKKWLFCVVLKLRKRKQATDKFINNGVLTGGLTYGYGLGQKDPETMESIQPVDFDPFAIDTTYFAAFGTNGMNIVMRVARRPDRCGEIWLFLDLPGIGQFQHPVHPDVHIANNDSSSFNISGLQFQVLEPMKQWRITYSGLLRVGLHNDINEKNEKFASVQMSFIWTAFTDCFNFDTDMSSDLISDGIAREPWTKQFYQKLESKHQTHYEQWGELRGRIKVEGFEEEKVCLKTVRDHTYGVRDWRAFHRYAIHFIWLETGLVAQIGVLCQPQIFTHLKIGYVSFPNADMVPITDVDLKLWEIGESGEPPEHYSFSFWADGQKFDVEVNGGMTLVWYHHEDRGNKILERFSTFKINGIPGRGLTEYCYRNFDGPSYIQDVSLPHLYEPLLKDLNEICRGATMVYFTDIASCNSQIVGGKGSQLALLTRIQNQVLSMVITSGNYY
ncbi:uncharacterized protein LOC126814892 isoform X2 [Patella vulgata]|uniref:uncharacterized protein LOC126814892 isoform X2 n=1 Tax=Patella vulgata TaxID=6465 RepID=UPI00217F2B03|nr:uncharacterized protein LOC126814892 isoform X2 [Patella vulgata]